jgi:DNA-binding transcriptional LysR family regulator
MKLESLDLNLLLLFEAMLAETHLTRAADKIGLTQPAASHALGRLRAVLGDPLFVRDRGRMVATARAQSLAPAVLDALRLLRGALETGAAFDIRSSTATVRLSMSDYGEHVLLPDMYATMRKEAPGVSIRVERAAALFEPPSERILSGAVDCAIGFFSPAGREPRLMLQPLYEEQFTFLVRRGHPALKQRLTLRRFAALEHIRILYPSEGSSGLIDALLRARGLERNVSITVPQFGAVPPIVANSDAVGTMPRRLAEHYMRGNALAILEPPLNIPPVSVTLVWQQRMTDDPVQAWFRSVVERAAERCRPGG